MKQLLAFSVLVILFSTGCNDERPTFPDRRNIGPEGSFYVPNQTDGTIYVFDSKTGARTDSMEAAVPAPHHIEFSPDNTYFYVVSRSSPGRIAKFSHETGELVDSTTTPGAVFPTAAQSAMF